MVVLHLSGLHHLKTTSWSDHLLDFVDEGLVDVWKLSSCSICSSSLSSLWLNSALNWWQYILEVLTQWLSSCWHP